MKFTRERLGVFFFTALLFCTLMYGINRIYGFILYPDEFGYWASAARLLGYDWSRIASLGSYYSYGYSILLVPILFLFENPVLAYRAAIAFNVLLLFGCFVLLRKIIAILFPKKRVETQIIFAAIAVCYPAWLFYMQMTLAEVVLVFGFCLVCFCLLNYLKEGHIAWLLLSVLAMAFLYAVHLRTVAVLIAASVVLVLRFIKQHRGAGQFLIFALFFVLCIGAGIWVKDIVQSRIYGGAGQQVLAINDYAGQWEKIRSIFTVSGILQFAVSLLGKVYYLGLSSFGLFFMGMAFVIRRLVKILREKKKWGKYFYFYTFLFLAACGEIAINAIYNKEYGRMDSLTYGRYDELVLPVLMALGLHELTFLCQNVRKLLRSAACIGIWSVAVTFLLEHVIRMQEVTNLHGGYFIPGLSYCLGFINYRPETFYWWACLTGMALTCIVFAIVFLGSRYEEWGQMLWMLVGMEIALGIVLNEQYTYPYNAISYGNVTLADVLQEKAQEGRRVVSYHNTGDDAFISTIQFLLRDEKIILVAAGEEEELLASDLVIISSVQEEQDYLQTHYKECKAYGSFWFYYNPEVE